MADTGLALVQTGAHIAGSGDDWNNPGNITAEAEYADCLVSKGDNVSDYLRGTDPNYVTEPDDNASIDGVEVHIRHKGPTSGLYDEAVYLTCNGSIISGCQNKASAVEWSGSQETYTYGGPTDTWGCSGLTAAVVKDLTFGPQLMVFNDSSTLSKQANVYWMKVKVFFTDQTGTTYEAEVSAAGGSSATVTAKSEKKAQCGATGNGTGIVSMAQKDAADGYGKGLLLSIRYGGVMHRYSLQDQTLGAQWHGVVMGVDPVKMALPTRHGGFLRVSAGQVRFAPSAFGGVDVWSINAWPPPKELDVTFRCKAGYESGAVKLFEGKLYRVSITETAVVYDVYISSFTETIAGGTSLASWTTTNSLIGFFEKVCNVLGLTLNSSKATGSPPALSHVLSNERLVIDVASEVAAFCSHLFWIEDGVLYLQQMSAANGALSLTDPNDFFRSPAYSDDIPVNRVVAGAYEYVGSDYPYGVDYSLSANYTGDNSQLQTIYDLVNAHWAEVATLPEIGYGKFVPGKQVTLRDARQVVPSETVVSMRSASYLFDDFRVVISGHATMNSV